MLTKVRKLLQRDDVAVSAVIGTILMIAATVILGGVIYAAVNGFGAKDTAPRQDLVFKAVAFDSNGDISTDSIKITYLSGQQLAGADVIIQMSRTSGAGGFTPPAAPADGNWDAGDFTIVKNGGADLNPGTFVVTISVAGSTVLDQTVNI